ncbi:hypothetical protein PR202_ga05500 [Eleusine coracana subsp. coracana]|uniref:BRCT domain-containing protein n=1 Tax=Eleusine coracana subsp. coracana TaxID=191504 RepID=A0AAV5BR64_ELECO|nr:hypothetical protein PR202_ga05047 [Eleusine coracana subsp. coracana]GJM89320.1 hypothetical protein PR202_ga05500 [Eleusine coracana subsp. coracana]
MYTYLSVTIFASQSKTATSPKAPKDNVVMNKAKLPPSDSKLSNPGAHQRSYLKSNVSRKESVTSKGIEAVTELKSMPTPINLYEDECVFCHSFRTSVLKARSTNGSAYCIKFFLATEDFLEEFACWTKATVANEWGENVTHVIVGKHAGRAWSRSYDVLMAILFGKWIVRTECEFYFLLIRTIFCSDIFTFTWIVDCLEMRPDVEDSYVVTFSDDSGKPLDGPKKGRTRAAEGAPKLFSGLHFCLSVYMNPRDRGHMLNLVAAAGGRVLERSSSLNWRWVRGDSSPTPYFVYDGGAPGELSASSLRMEAEEAREQAAAGARVISHLTVLDAVAAYDVEVLNQKSSA